MKIKRSQAFQVESAEDGNVLAKMLGFLYTSDYKVADRPPMHMHAALYLMSLGTGIPTLQLLCRHRFEQELSTDLASKRVEIVEGIPVIHNGTFASDKGIRVPLIRCVSSDLVTLLNALHFEQVRGKFQTLHSIWCGTRLRRMTNRLLGHAMHVGSATKPRKSWTTDVSWVVQTLSACTLTNSPNTGKAAGKTPSICNAYREW